MKANQDPYDFIGKGREMYLDKYNRNRETANTNT